MDLDSYYSTCSLSRIVSTFKLMDLFLALAFKGDGGRLDRLCETPSADPHARCCGGWRVKTPGYPIGILCSYLNKFYPYRRNSERHQEVPQRADRRLIAPCFCYE